MKDMHGNELHIGQKIIFEHPTRTYTGVVYKISEFEGIIEIVLDPYFNLKLDKTLDDVHVTARSIEISSNEQDYILLKLER